MKLEQIRFSNILLLFLLLAFFAVPTQVVYAQDMDDEGEMFWGEDEEEYEGDEEEYEDDFDSEDVDLADQAENMGWSIDISGSSPRFVN